MLQKIVLKLKKSVWIYPLIISFISLLGAMGIGMVDSGSFIVLSEIIPEIFLTSVELSKNILGVIAGSLITMTTFTFSTTMVVLTTYSSQFSPRTVENFLSDDNTMKTLGVFMGGFLYSIVALLFMRSSFGNQLVIAATLGIVYAIVCLVQFIMYIHHVGSYIQTNNLIDRIRQMAERKIEEYISLINNGTYVDKSTWENDNLVLRIKSKEEGYIQLINHSGIYSAAKEIKGTVVLQKINGEFITDETIVFSIYFDEEVEVDEDSIEKLLSCIALGKQKSEIQDFNFSMQKIIEIALRAISPGVNDPNTARHCLRIIGVLLGKVIQVEGGHMLYQEEDGYPKVAFELIDFKKELRTSYDQILHYGKEDISVMRDLLISISFIAEKASNQNKKALYDYLQHIWLVLKKTHANDYDLAFLEKEKVNIEGIILKNS